MTFELMLNRFNEIYSRSLSLHLVCHLLSFLMINNRFIFSVSKQKCILMIQLKCTFSFVKTLIEVLKSTKIINKNNLL